MFTGGKRGTLSHVGAMTRVKDEALLKETATEFTAHEAGAQMFREFGESEVRNEVRV